jgi:signal transduction histidine kinase
MNRDRLAKEWQPPSVPDVEAANLCKLVDDWPLGMAWLDAADRVVAVNQTLCAWWRSTQAALLGRRIDELWQLGGGVDEPRARCGQASFERRLVRPDGSTLGVYGRLIPLAQESGGAVLVLLDLTERMAAEQALRESDRYKTEFLSVLSHELRNPLAPMRTALALLQREVLSVRGGQALEIAQRQLNQCIRIVDDLLDTSRLSQGKVSLRVERVLLSRVMQTVLENTQAMRSERNQQLHLVGIDQPIWLSADPARLQQIFENVLINASKYTDQQGWITVRITVDAQHVTVQIADTGVGVAREQLPHMFELFKQVDSQANRSAGGLGIGLALVKQLVELHGGQVAMHSDGLGQGTTVTIELPHRARRMDERATMWRELG